MHNAKKRILFVDHTAKMGGGEIALLNLMSCLDRDAVEPLLLLFSDGPLRERVDKNVPVRIVPLPVRILEARKETIGFQFLTKIKDITASCLFIYRLRQSMRELDVDVVHTNSLKADILGGVAARLAGLPVVWHVRDRISIDYLPSAAVTMFRLCARVIPNRIIANSMSTLSTLRRPRMAKERVGSLERRFQGRCCVVQDGVRGDAAMSLPQGKRNQVVVGLVGRISPWKGQDIFLKAAAIVRERFPATVFRIIGSPLFGEHCYEDQLLSLCRELGLERNVDFTGFVEDVGAAINDLDILVHASTLPEPFGQVIIEGMAAGKPVIATNGGGVPEIVIDQMTGLLVPMKDVEAMADAMHRLIASREEREEMGRNGRSRVIECFRMDDVARKVERVYDELLSKDSPSASRVVKADRFVTRSTLEMTASHLSEK